MTIDMIEARVVVLREVVKWAENGFPGVDRAQAVAFGPFGILMAFRDALREKLQDAIADAKNRDASAVGVRDAADLAASEAVKNFARQVAAWLRSQDAANLASYRADFALTVDDLAPLAGHVLTMAAKP